jgi:RNA polymerase sigma factor FliA
LGAVRLVQETWQKYKDNPSQDLRNELLLHYVPFVETLAKQVVQQVPLSFEELRSAGIQALFSLLDQYNPDSGVPFEGFAHLRIRGSMIDETRTVNRTIRKSSNAYQKAQDAYSSASRHVSLDDMSEATSRHDWLVDHNVQSGEDALLKSESRFELQQAIGTLSEQEQIVLSLYFVEEKKLNEIASILELSPSYVGKIYHGCIQKLRFILARNRAKNQRK